MLPRCSERPTFLKEFSDVWSVLQGVFVIPWFWPKSVQSGVYIYIYIYIYGVVYVVWYGVVWCIVVWYDAVWCGMV